MVFLATASSRARAQAGRADSVAMASSRSDSESERIAAQDRLRRGWVVIGSQGADGGAAEASIVKEREQLMGQIRNVPLNQRAKKSGAHGKRRFRVRHGHPQRGDRLGLSEIKRDEQGLFEDVRITRRHQFGECARPAFRPGNLLATAERIEDSREQDLGGRLPRSARVPARAPRALRPRLRSRRDGPGNCE